MDTTLVTSHDAASAGAVLQHRRVAGVAADSVVSSHRWALVATLAVPAVWVDLWVVARSIDAAWMWAVAFVGQTLAVVAAGVLVRRAAVARLFPTRRANRIAGHFLGALLVLPYSVFAPQHREARLRARREDGSLWAVDGRVSAGLAIDAQRRRVMGYRSWHEAVRILAGESHEETHSRPHLRSALISVLGCVWMLSIVAIGMRFEPFGWLIAWFAPLAAGTAVLTAWGAIARPRASRLDRQTFAFVVESTTSTQPIVPASRSWSISAGS